MTMCVCVRVACVCGLCLCVQGREDGNACVCGVHLGTKPYRALKNETCISDTLQIAGQEGRENRARGREPLKRGGAPQPSMLPRRGQQRRPPPPQVVGVCVCACV